MSEKALEAPIRKTTAIQETSRSLFPDASEWWAVLGSNQWPLRCETEVRGLRIKYARAGAKRNNHLGITRYPRDITPRHDLTVPKIIPDPRSARGSRDARGIV